MRLASGRRIRQGANPKALRVLKRRSAAERWRATAAAWARMLAALRVVSLESLPLHEITQRLQHVGTALDAELQVGPRLGAARLVATREAAKPGAWGIRTLSAEGASALGAGAIGGAVRFGSRRRHVERDAPS